MIKIKKNTPIPVEHSPEEWKQIAENIYEEDWKNIYTIKKNVIESVWKEVPPLSQRYEIVWNTHISLNHRSKNFVLHELQKKYYWNSMADDILFVLKHCKLCMEKRSSKTYAVKHKITVPKGPADLYSIDLSYFVEDTRRGKLIMCHIVNNFTKKLYGYLLEQKSSKETANALKNLLNNDGIEIERIRSDRGKEFCGEFSEILEEHGITHEKTAPYSPWQNGCVERINKEIKDQLITKMRENNDGNWSRYYNDIIDLWNKKLHTSIGCSPNEAEQKTTLPKNLENISPETIANIKFNSEKIKHGILKAGQRAVRNAMKGKKEMKFEENDTVLIKPPSRYRRKGDLPFCKKAVLLRPVDSSRMNWNVKFLETGGWLEKDLPFTSSSTVINVNQMKKYTLGDDEGLIHHITTREYVKSRNIDEKDGVENDERPSDNEEPIEEGPVREQALEEPAKEEPAKESAKEDSSKEHAKEETVEAPTDAPTEIRKRSRRKWKRRRLQ